MRVCSISRRGPSWLVDGLPVCGAEGAYAAFRRLWNAALGGAVRHRLGVRWLRTERLHDAGCHFRPWYAARLSARYGGCGRVRAYLLGLVGTSYCRIVDVSDYAPALSGSPSEWGDAEEVESEVDWLLCAGSTSLLGRRDKAGRAGRNYAMDRAAALRAARGRGAPGASR